MLLFFGIPTKVNTTSDYGSREKNPLITATPLCANLENKILI